MKQTRYLTMIDQPFPERPLVSIVIPAYNAADWIERTLSSVLSQTCPHLEVLVIDDNLNNYSNNRTATVVEAIAQRDPRVILFRQPNFGVAAARNLGNEQIKGEFIASIDADDLWYPAQLQGQIACFLSSPAAVGVVYSWSDIDDIDAGDVYTRLLCRNFLGNANCTMIGKSTLLTAGGYNSKFRFYGYGEGIVSYHLTTLLNNGDWRALLSLFVGLPLYPLYDTKRIFLRLLGQISYPLSLLLTEIRGNLMRASARWKLHQRWQQGHSAPYVPPNPPSLLTPELILSSR